MRLSNYCVWLVSRSSSIEVMDEPGAPPDSDGWLGGGIVNDSFCPVTDDAQLGVAAMPLTIP